MTSAPFFFTMNFIFLFWLLLMFCLSFLFCFYFIKNSIHEDESIHIYFVRILYSMSAICQLDSFRWFYYSSWLFIICFTSDFKYSFTANWNGNGTYMQKKKIIVKIKWKYEYLVCCKPPFRAFHYYVTYLYVITKYSLHYIKHKKK